MSDLIRVVDALNDPARQDDERSFYLEGYMEEPGNPDDWRAKFITFLHQIYDMDKIKYWRKLVLVNPKRADWSKAWRQDDKNVIVQTKWEASQENKHNYVFNFDVNESSVAVANFSRILGSGGRPFAICCSRGHPRSAYIHNKISTNQLTKYDTLLDMAQAIADRMNKKS